MFRFFGDQGDLQTSDPTGYNYVSAHTDTGARIRLSYGTTAGHRPWFKALAAKLHGGYLKEGDSITIVFGDTSQGSPGMKLQTRSEEHTSELQSLMRISYAVFRLKKKKN